MIHYYGRDHHHPCHCTADFDGQCRFVHCYVHSCHRRWRIWTSSLDRTAVNVVFVCNGRSLLPWGIGECIELWQLWPMFEHPRHTRIAWKECNVVQNYGRLCPQKLVPRGRSRPVFEGRVGYDGWVCRLLDKELRMQYHPLSSYVYQTPLLHIPTIIRAMGQRIEYGVQSRTLLCVWWKDLWTGLCGVCWCEPSTCRRREWHRSRYGTWIL